MEKKVVEVVVAVDLVAMIRFWVGFRVCVSGCWGKIYLVVVLGWWLIFSCGGEEEIIFLFL